MASQIFERQQLATLYAVGQTLWRVPIPHFSPPWDLNLAYGPPTPSGPPGPPPPFPGPNGPGPCQQPQSSTIECQRQSLGEDLAVAGTPYSLHYESDRQQGREPQLEIPLTGPSLLGTVLNVVLQVSVAGRSFVQTFPAQANQTTTFGWDGRDAYGRLLQGGQPIAVQIGNTYQGVYQNIAR